MEEQVFSLPMLMNPNPLSVNLLICLQPFVRFLSNCLD